MAHDSPTSAPTFRRACAVGLALLLLATAVHLWRHHFIKAYSDPLNWLEYARDFRHQFTASKWPFGYPLFLAGLLPVLGPVWIFLANLPVLLLLTWMVAVLARRALGPGHPAAPLAGLLAACFLVATNQGLFVYLDNPYRDPLSYVLLLCGVLAFFRHARVRTASPAWMALCGLCVGAGYCVRETSVVLIPFLFLAGVLAWAEDRSRSFWKPALAFAAGLLLGVLPFLVQSRLATGDAFTPVQSNKEGKLIPGMHLHQAAVLLPEVGRVYLRKYTVAGVAAVLAGVVFLVRARRWAALVLVAGPAAGYFVFYSFYYTYVPRYYFSTDLFFAPLAGIGAAWAARGLGRLPWPRRPGLRAWAGALLAPVAVAALLAAVPREKTPHFRAADARRLAADMRGLFPAGSTVLCDRNLCEILRWFAPVESFQAEALVPEGPWTQSSFATPEIARRLAAGRAVFAVHIRAPLASRLNTVCALDGHDLAPVRQFHARDYNLVGVLGRHEVEIFRVTPWTNLTATVTLPAPGPEVRAVRVSGRSLWRDPRRTRATLRVNGLPLADRLEDGLNLFVLPAELDPAQPWVFTLDSDAPVPAELGITPIFRERPTAAELGVDSDPADTRLLGEGFLGRDCPDRAYRLMVTNGALRVPAWRDPDHWLAAEVEYRMPTKLPGLAPARIRLSTPGVPDVSAPAPYDRKQRALRLVLPPKPAGLDWLEFRLDLSEIPVAQNPIFHPEQAEVDRVLLIPVPRRSDYTVELPGVAGDPFRVSGFFPMEKTAQGERVIWSDPACALDVWLQPSGVPEEVVLHGYDRRPPRAPPAAPRCRWNGADQACTYALAPDGTFALTLLLPAERLREGANRLEVEVAGWQPSAFDASPDRRHLGLLWRDLTVRPVTP